MRDVDLSLVQKTRKILGLSSVPGFSFEVVMSVPVAIQLDDSSPIPLVMRVIPRRDGSSSDIWDVVQRVDVIAVKMSILSKVEILLKPSEESFYKIPNDEHVFVQDLGLEKAYKTQVHNLEPLLYTVTTVVIDTVRVSPAILREVCHIIE